MNIRVLIIIIVIFFAQNNKISAQTYGDNFFYLIDSLDLDKLVENDSILIDSCLKVYHKSTHDTIKIEALNHIVSESWDNNVWPKYNDWLYEFIKQRIDQKPPPSGVILEWLKYSLAVSTNNKGVFQDMKGNYNEALKYYKECLEIHTRSGNKEGIAISYFNIGYINKVKGGISVALQYYYKALKIQEEIGDLRGAAHVYGNIAIILKGQGEIDKALEYFNKGLVLQEKINDKKGVSGALHNIGSIYFSKGKLDTSLNYFNKSLKLQEELNDRIGIAFSFRSIGNVLNEKGEVDKAQNYYYKGLKLSTEIDDKQGIAASHHNIAQIYFKGNKLGLALDNAKKALEITRILENPDLISSNAKLLSEIYEKQNKGIESLKMHKLYIAMRDSTHNESTQIALAHQEEKYNYDHQKELDDAEYEKQLAIEKEIEHKQEIIIFSIAIGLVLVLIILLFIFTLLQNSQKEEQEAKSLNKKLETAIQENKDYEAFIEANNDAVFMLDKFGKQLYFNSQIEELTGHTKGFMIGKSFTKFVPIREIPKYLSQLKSIFLNKEISGFETYIKHKSGKEIPVEINGRILRHNNKLVALGTMRDITIRLENQQKLKFQANLAQILNIVSRNISLKEIFDKTLKVLFEIDFISIEQKGLIFLKNNEGDLELKAHTNVGALETICATVKPGQCLCGKAMEMQEVLFCNSVGHDHTTQPDEMEPHGHYIVPIKNESNNVLGILCLYIKEGEEKDEQTVEYLETVTGILAQKIVEEKQKEELNIATQKVAESEIKYKSIIEDSNDLIYQTDYKGNFTYANEVTPKVIGYSIEEFTSFNFMDLVLDSHKKEIASFYKQNWRDNSDLINTYVEFPMICKDGSTKWIGQKVNVVFEDEAKTRIKYFQAIARDITKEKEAEEENRTLLEDLQVKEDTLRKITESQNSVFWLSDWESNTIDYISPSYELLFERTVESIINDSDSWYDTIHPDDKDAVRKAYINDVPKGTYDIEFRIFAKDGSIKWVRETAFPVNPVKGIFGKVSGISENITARKLTEDKLLKSEHDFRLINETIPDVFYLYNIVDSKYDYISPNCEKILGASQEDFYKGLSHTKMLVFDEDIPLLDQAKMQVESGVEYEIEFRIIKNNQTFWIREKSFPIKDEKGSVIQNSGICQDITKEKAISDELEKLSLVASKATSYVIIADENDKIEWVNETFTQITGFTFDEAIGNITGELLKGGLNNKQIQLQIIKELKTGNSFQGELLNYKKNGEEVWLSLNVTPIIRDGKVYKYISIGNDVTKQKTNELRLEKLKEYFEFLHYIGSSLIDEKNEINLMKTVLMGVESLFSNILRCSFIDFNLKKDTATYVNMSYVDNVISEAKPILSPLSKFESIDNLKKGLYFYEKDILKKVQLTDSDKQNIEDGIKSSILLPLMKDQEVFGAIAVGFNAIDPLEELELTMFNELASMTSSVMVKNRLSEEVNYHLKEIMSSIGYAKKIQSTILPNDNALSNYFKDQFVIYLPKEQVSGDYYWFKQMTDNPDKAVFGVIDCTGHGVPGAFVSMIGNRYLSNSVVLNKEFNPSKILSCLHVGVSETMRNDSLSLHDGMDVSLCSYDKKSKKLQFSGAVNSLFHIRNGELVEYKGDMWSIGSLGLIGKPESVKFETIEIDILNDDIIFMTSDGYLDQFGGPKDKRIMRKRFKELLLKNSDLSMKELHSYLLDFFHEWKGFEEQTDDVTVMGVKF